MSDISVVFNGVDGTTGKYLSSYRAEDIAGFLLGKPPEAVCEVVQARAHDAERAYGLPFGVDPMDLSQTGWGVIFAHEDTAETANALMSLLALRKQQAGDRYREFSAARAHRPGESARTWLRRQCVTEGPAQVTKVPYYLLIVGSPESISFRFQYELGVNYAVGRLSFDTPEEYRNYAQSVVASELARAQSAPRRAVFFGVCNRGDQATQMSSDLLVKPLVTSLVPAMVSTWQIHAATDGEATKAFLNDQINTAEPPNLLFTASHGMGFPNGHDRQFTDQGALLCQDWRGPILHRGPISRDLYFSAADVANSANLSKTIAFHFACYGAGTPKLDEFGHAKGVRGEIAPSAFLARLPQRMLGKPDGAALAIIGHVERAWSYSFSSPETGSQTTTFRSCLSALMAGARVGAAMDAFSMRHAALAVNLNGELEDIRFGAKPDERLLAGLWTANNDARNYLVMGDPAVRIPD